MALPIAMLFPALWALAPTRWAAAGVSAGYFLTASRGLPQGVMNFYGSGLEAGLTLWLSASLSFVIVYGLLWTKRRGWRSATRYAIAAVLMSVPPFGIVGWAHPITAAGVVFPGWGWAGLAAAAIGLLVMTTRHWPIAILTLGGLWIWSAATWTAPSMPQAWAEVDTSFRNTDGRYAGYDQHRETLALVRAVAAHDTQIVVLPETALGAWTPTVERLWSAALANMDIGIVGGAIAIGADGYDNVMLEVTSTAHRVLYRERMPVPISMWQPWLGLMGQPGGARAHFFDNPVVDVAGLRAAPLICYEQLLVWPMLQSALHSPTAIIAIGNGWWTEGTDIVEIQQAATIAWASLFDLPLAIAFNR